MKLFEQLRRIAFWSKDLLTGGSVLKHYSAINSILSINGSEVSNDLPNKYLKNILEHAVKNCLFYSKYSDNINLTDFPVINKTQIKEKQDQFLADNYRTQKLYPVTTSGSTGTPFKTYHNRNKKLRNYADTLYFAGLAGYNPGHRLLYLKIWVEKKMRGKLEYWFQNIFPIDVIHFNDKEIESLIIKMEQENSTFSILGYASALELICSYLDRKNYKTVKTNVKSIIAISETLNDYTKSTIFKYFGISVVSRYSNLENGIIAQQELNSQGNFLINTASYHLEILKFDSNEQSEEESLGRIVVTDLFNYAMPMIRYDTGDIGSIVIDYEKGGRKYLSRVEGRKLDLLYNTKGDLVSSYIVYKNMWQYTEIDQYQLIQENAKLYIFKINSREIFLKEEQLVNEFKSFLGTDADFRIEYVTEIPLLASGKRKKIVNNYIKQ